MAPALRRTEVLIDLTAALVAVTGDTPRVLSVSAGTALPSGPLESSHRSAQMGMRAWIEQQTRLSLAHIEQLYTFADRDRTKGGRRIVSIGYLALTQEAATSAENQADWRDWYSYFPWEDWRAGTPAVIRKTILPALQAWAAAAPGASQQRARKQRINVSFPRTASAWNEELALQRYELLYEAALVHEATRAQRRRDIQLGVPMLHDHRRILATAIGRLRSKIKYRPIVFELMPRSFTLLQLQRAVEALAGRRLHKQNFRRLITFQGLVEETGKLSAATRGRPAKLFRFRRAVLPDSAVTLARLPLTTSD